MAPPPRRHSGYRIRFPKSGIETADKRKIRHRGGCRTFPWRRIVWEPRQPPFHRREAEWNGHFEARPDR